MQQIHLLRQELQQLQQWEGTRQWLFPHYRHLFQDPQYLHLFQYPQYLHLFQDGHHRIRQLNPKSEFLEQ